MAIQPRDPGTDGGKKEEVKTGGKKFDTEKKGGTAFSFSALPVPGSGGNSELNVEFSTFLLLRIR